ncbi:MAG: tetratricopeptide repeat protein [Leptolyngbya sp. SIO3F4]|nr:tetratricopeptide repeat protein [Leptolyngbya sp. SIO3F4]
MFALRTYVRGLVLLLLFASLYQCSTKKTGWAHRTYHTTTARYNGYFNAKELIKNAVNNLEENHEEDFTQLLPIFIYGTEETAQGMYGDMDKAIEKCTRVINRHSIKKREKEHVRWIDDCYFLIGQANFYKREYSQGKQFFEYVSKKYKGEESRYDAMLWLVRTYIEQEKFEKAERLLRLAEGESELPERLRPDVRLLYAELYIQQQNYKLAIPELKVALTLLKKKRYRVRVAYLIGQLYKLEGEYANASGMFAQVIKMHPDYKMTFYAKIQRAMSYDSEFGGKEEVKQQLRKMLADEKYIEFRDQIYYALAEMEFRDRNMDETKDLLHKSVEASVSNDQQKALSFLRLGEIHFDELDYENSQAYYDSCVTFLDPGFERYEEVIKIAENLNDLVEQITIINTEDSLQRVAAMSEDERYALIDDIIQARIEEEERKKAEQEASILADSDGGGFGGPGGGPGGPGGFPGGGPGGNKWYFYNPSAMSFGSSEFRRLWGSRKNEDHWRRSSKRQVTLEPQADAFGDADTAQFVLDENGDTILLSNDWQDPEYYLKDLPLTEESKTASDERIIDAYYKLAIIYKEQLDDVNKAIETLETLNKRYPGHKHLDGAYYRLYRMYTDLGEYSQADVYKERILNEFPDSDYAKLVVDPEYFAKQNQLDEKAEIFYKRTYGYFQRGFYKQTLLSCEEGLLKYGNSELGPKFKFLRALALGQENGRERMVSELRQLSQEYGQDEIGARANELLAALEEQDKEKKEAALAAEREQQALEQAAQSPYAFEPNSKHDVIVLVPTKGNNLPGIKTAISNFNMQNYRMEGLKVSAVILNADTQMVTIKSFSSAQRAMEYLANFNADKMKLIRINAPNYPRFAISFDNFPVFFKRKDPAEYKAFYDTHYKNL